MSCSACIHWRRTDMASTDPIADQMGACRRRPPRIVDAQLVRNMRIQGAHGEISFDYHDIVEASLFPITWGASACGEEQGQMPC